MRKKLAVANWKMHKTLQEGETYAQALAEKNIDANKNVVIIPSFIHLAPLTNILKTTQIAIGAQNCHSEDKGAFTGEISAGMIKSCGAEYVIIGHSERRKYFFENEQILAKKITAALNTGLTPIYCCGEDLIERQQDKQKEVIERQLKEGLFNLPASSLIKTVIAYEPVWAIGTGNTASPADAQDMHYFIRELIANHYDQQTADAVSIIYGGSCNCGNCKELFSQKDIDGGLIGSASLDPEEFLQIIDNL